VEEAAEVGGSVCRSGGGSKGDSLLKWLGLDKPPKQRGRHN
jgi:hypothetical protein